MSDTKHSPGPWKVEGLTVYALMSDGFHRGIERMRNRFTAFVQPDRECSEEEAVANARLMKSAPDLLEFAEEVRRSGDTRLASMAIAVIAKATGEPK